MHISPSFREFNGSTRKGAFSGSAPNVLFLLADDLGYNELGYMNSSRGLKTPNIDDLAKTGVALKNYYVEPICSPTRSALMTGKYPLRLGTQANVIYWDTPWSIGLEHAFIPEHLKAAGVPNCHARKVAFGDASQCLDTMGAWIRRAFWVSARLRKLRYAHFGLLQCLKSPGLRR